MPAAAGAVLPESALADRSGGDAEFRATTSAGDSRPVCVTVREGVIGEALGRDGVLPRPRRDGGRGAALGVAR
jgi:hypothetical protein